MAFKSTTSQPVATPVSEKPAGNHADGASLLSMLVLSVYAAQKSKKNFRKLRRKFMWTAFKLKLKSFFKKPAASDRQIILYILLGAVALVLVFYYPLAALIIGVIALILILTGTI
ncbi:MAG TPA: hypothetical protein VHK91_18045 [Flavisolibacter sp.]|jgi:hypothetical protein|nr:hypothetical protein [Flavisolibacter sp.]